MRDRAVCRPETHFYSTGLQLSREKKEDMQEREKDMEEKDHASDR